MGLKIFDLFLLVAIVIKFLKRIKFFEQFCVIALSKKHPCIFFLSNLALKLMRTICFSILLTMNKDLVIIIAHPEPLKREMAESYLATNLAAGTSAIRRRGCKFDR